MRASLQTDGPTAARQPLAPSGTPTVALERARTILVVDGDACMRDLVRLHLTNAGYEVETAKDSVAALNIVLRRRPALLIADFDLPYLTGLELVSSIRGDPNFSELPVIFVTARDDVDAAAREVGALICLPKPLLSTDLIRAVVAALPNGRIVL